MAKPRETFSKQEKEKKKEKKRKEKQMRKEERQSEASSTDLDSMIAYVDEFGNIVDTPPDPNEKEEISVDDIVIGVPKKEKNEDADINKGKVDFFNDQKGFGFIKELETNKSYFFHVKGTIDEVREGDKVTFDLEQGMKGINAVNVKKMTS